MAEEKVKEEPSKEGGEPKGIRKVREFDKEQWKPKTEIGMKVKSGEIKEIDEIFNSGLKILEEGVIDSLIPNLESDLLMIGQSKGKFGGGKRSIWKQTQKKTREGNKPQFAALALIGNKDGYVGIGYGKSKETMPTREKALRMAKLNIIKVKRGCGSWDCSCGNPHSIPFKVSGKCGSIKIELIPAPRGTGLCIEKECKKLLESVGIKDIYSKTFNPKTKLNLIKACFQALKNISEVKVKPEFTKKLGIT